MFERLRKVFTFNGLFILIGVLGGLASILTLFNSNYDFKINVKWFLFLIYVFITTVIILLKVLYDLQQEFEKGQFKPHFRIIKYQKSTEEFLIEKSELLEHNALVSIFYSHDDFETEIGKAYVSNVNDRYFQLKIITISDNLSNEIVTAINKIKNNDAKEIKNVTIKSFVTKN
ncbi:hypothetical protein [Tenacibaculum sp.]|uniref:hypothetical protein n=1 Tax=Tenacibaculum sp. TaxID=1906242 RepID=UPI003D13EEEE